MKWVKYVSSEDIIRNMLSNDHYRAIVRHCKNAHTASEIIQYLQSKWPQTLPREYWERVVGDGLSSLEKAGALMYDSGKWQTTKNATDFLEKYFGGS